MVADDGESKARGGPWCRRALPSEAAAVATCTSRAAVRSLAAKAFSGGSLARHLAQTRFRGGDKNWRGGGARKTGLRIVESLPAGPLQQGDHDLVVGCRDARGRGSVEAKLLQLLGALENARQKNRASAAGTPCWVDCRKPHDGFVDWFLANLAEQPMGRRLCFQLLLALKRFDRIERRRALQKPAKRG